jgi:hypothetical protein
MTRTAEGTAAAAGDSATNATWPNCGASVGYPARNHPTILFSIPVRIVVRFIWLLPPRGWCLHLRAGVEMVPDIRCTRNYGFPVLVARLCAQAAKQAIFSFCALCSAGRSARIHDVAWSVAELSAVPYGCTANRFPVDSLGQPGAPVESRGGPIN